MKYIFSMLLVTVILTSCEKENLLEGIELNNPYDLEVVNYIEIINVRQLGCETIEIDLKLNTENIPPSLNYTHFVLKRSNSSARKINLNITTDIKFLVDCNTEDQIFMTLYDDVTDLESLPSVYNYIP